jgi:hypothetical protein
MTTPDKRGLNNMRLTAGVMREALSAQLDGTDAEHPARYYMSEAEGNLGQFIEEIEKALEHV